MDVLSVCLVAVAMDEKEYPRNQVENFGVVEFGLCRQAEELLLSV